MIVSAALVIVGLILLIGGADLLIRGATALAAAAGVPAIVIGLTVVAFGTSLPELVVNSTAAFHGEPGLAFGNIVGSCAINLGWVLALTALVRPLQVQPSIITREIPMMLLATASLVILASDQTLNRAPAGQLDRGDGVMLLLLFVVFLYYTARNVVEMSRAERREDPFLEEAVETVTETPRRPAWISAAMMLAGIVGVAAGGRLTVLGAVRLAEGFGVPEVIIGLTIISFGTTLPELTTGIMAARRGESDIAIGNVVGSNIFNLLFIGGTVSTIRPIPVPAGGYVDLLVMAGLSAALLPIAIRGPRRVTRAEGALLLTAYLSYAIWRTLTTSA